MRALVLATFVLAACEAPDTHLVYAISDGAEQGCGSTNCADVKVPCEAVISIRILRPSDDVAPLFTICEPLPRNRNKDLCAISSVDLGDRPLQLPKETLEVQMLIWERTQVETETGDLDCAKYDVKFDAVGGFPIAHQPAPAIGGHTFYHPGDSETRITLGCTDLPALDQCVLEDNRELSVSIESFENLGISVSAPQATRFKVDVGEPKLDINSNAFVLELGDTQALTLMLLNQVIPIWKATTDLTFTTAACAQVLEDAAQATAALTCTSKNLLSTEPLEIRGVQLPKATLDQILVALGASKFPTAGLTVGIVLDPLFNPVAGQVVTTTDGTVRYLSANRTSFGGTMTTASGIFVSTDANFGARFAVAGVEDQVGGHVTDKVTVVVLQK